VPPPWPSSGPGVEYILGVRERSTDEVRNDVMEDDGVAVPLAIPRQKGETQLKIKDAARQSKTHVRTFDCRATIKDVTPCVPTLSRMGSAPGRAWNRRTKIGCVGIGSEPSWLPRPDAGREAPQTPEATSPSDINSGRQRRSVPHDPSAHRQFEKVRDGIAGEA
jgi:hypothetical protein